MDLPGNVPACDPDQKMAQLAENVGQGQQEQLAVRGCHCVTLVVLWF